MSMPIRKAGSGALLIAFLLPFFTASAFAGKAEGFRLGVGGGLFQMRAKIQNDPNTYKAFVPGYTARLGYAFSPSWEVGAMISGGGNRSDTQGGKTVKLKMPVLPQAYILGRYYASQTYGMYGMLSLGAMKQEIINTTGRVTSSNRSVALGVGAGLFWDVSDQYTIDVGGFMPGIRLSNTNSALKTYTPGLLATLSYAFGDDTDARMPVARVRRDEPVKIVKEAPELKPAEIIQPDAVIKKNAESEVEEVASKRVGAPIALNKIHLERIVFQPYSAALSQQAKVILDNAIEQLVKLPGTRVEVAAHSDTSGHTAENLQLSIKRAESVRGYLIVHGIDASRVEAKGYGETQPLFDNATAEGRAKNRRVELRIIK